VILVFGICLRLEEPEFHFFPNIIKKSEEGKPRGIAPIQYIPKCTLPNVLMLSRLTHQRFISGPLAIIYFDDSPAYSPIPMYINVIAYFK